MILDNKDLAIMRTCADLLAIELGGKMCVPVEYEAEKLLYYLKIANKKGHPKAWVPHVNFARHLPVSP